MFDLLGRGTMEYSTACVLAGDYGYIQVDTHAGVNAGSYPSDLRDGEIYILHKSIFLVNTAMPCEIMWDAAKCSEGREFFKNSDTSV